MIQILLAMLKLSLPGPNPTDLEATKARKRRKKEKKKKNVDVGNGEEEEEFPIETDAERLENYMDKLAVWQLTASINGLAPMQSSKKDAQMEDRHWTQAFTEDVVDPLYVSFPLLPSLANNIHLSMNIM